MNLAASAPAWLAAILLILLVVAAMQDLWRLEISNWLSGGVAVGAFLAMAVGGPISGLWQNLLLFAAVLGLGSLLFARGWMGGGDVKLLAAVVLWFNFDQGWRVLVAVAVIGGLVALVMILLRLLPWPSAVRHHLRSLARDEGIPYGVAIAAAVAMMAWRPAW